MVNVAGIAKGAKIAGKGVLTLVELVGVKDLVALGASLTQKGVDAGVKAHAEKVEEKKALIEVPAILSPEYRLILDDAKRWLEEDGLKAEAVVIKPDIAFKDCVAYEVVGTNFKLKQKVKPGTRIILKYVTDEVIEESQRLFKISEKEKADEEQKKSEERAKKAEKRIENSEINKVKRDAVVANIKQGTNNAVDNAKKGVGDIVSKVKKK